MDAHLLQQLKLTYGNVFEINIRGDVFYVRQMRRAEYRYILDNFQTDADVAICTSAVLWPEGYDFAKRGKAGITANLADQIVALSHLQSAGQYTALFAEEKAKMRKFESQAESYIRYVFQNITFEEMGNWTMEEFMKHLARAEWVMTNVLKIPGAEFIPEEPEKQEEEIPVEPPTLKEIGDELREQGIDPMLYLIEDIRARNRKPFVEFPMIGGVGLLQNEEALNNVREQIQRVSK